MKVIIDRFEGEYAVLELEDLSTVTVSRKLIPGNAKEGSVLVISCDEEETENRQKKMKNKMSSVFHK
ncbi:MAG: DUF3006 domain-containing protein [Clostridiales bacterium]|nr:DUF3006 domain-containing protein [Clostridiales bacterium]